MDELYNLVTLKSRQTLDTCLRRYDEATFFTFMINIDSKAIKRFCNKLLSQT